MSKSTSQSNITAASVLEPGKLAKFDDTTHLPDDAPPKSCCCAPCWTKFTDWLSNVWKTIVPCCITTGVIAAHLAIEVGEDVAEVKINGAPNLDAIQKAALIAALEQASKTISGGMEDQSHVFTVNVPDHAIPLGGDSILHDVGNA